MDTKSDDDVSLDIPYSENKIDAESDSDLLRMRQMWGDGKARPMPTPKITEVRSDWTPPEPPEPSDEERARAAKLTTHDYVEDLLFRYIGGRVLWPKEDHVGDQLEGFVHPKYKRFCWATSSDDEDEDEDGEVSEVSDWDD